MKNVFLITTAVVSISLTNSVLSNNKQNSSALKYSVVLGGTIDVQAAPMLNHKTVIKPDGERAIILGATTDVHLKATAKTDYGMSYGARFGIKPTISVDGNVNYLNLNKTYVFVEGKDLGLIEIGTNDSAGDMMNRGAGSVAAATGGVEGDFVRYLTENPMMNGAVIMTPRLSLENDNSVGIGGFPVAVSVAAKAKKITYMSPKFSGIQVGVSYIPDSVVIGYFSSKVPAVAIEEAGLASLTNGISGGLMWSGDLNKKDKIEVSITGELAKSLNDKIYDTKGMIVSAKAEIDNFKIAGSYGLLGKTNFSKPDDSADPSITDPKDSWFMSLGGGVKVGELYYSLTGMYGSRNSNISKILSFGMDYNLAPGFLPYIEATYSSFETKAGSAKYNPKVLGIYMLPIGSSSIDNKFSSTVFLLGVKVKF